MPTGYGVLSVKKRNVLAHRLSWMLHRGDIPVGLFVCHRCDNPACVNPNHLFLGTNADNVADMVAKGRQQRGERQWRSFLTADVVREIRQSGESGRAIARRLGISAPHVSQIRHGRRWAHVTEVGA